MYCIVAPFFFFFAEGGVGKRRRDWAGGVRVVNKREGGGVLRFFFFFLGGGGGGGGAHLLYTLKYKPEAKPITHLNYWGKGNWDMAPEQGLEPRTYWLTADRKCFCFLGNNAIPKK